MGFIGDAAAVGMAVGPPLIYVDQARQIVKSRDSSGFSHDICAVVIIANIIRCFFFLGHPFETALIVQSILLIISQLFLLSLCIHYKPVVNPTPDVDNPGQAFSSKFANRRPFDFWQWDRLGTYIEFLAGLIVTLTLAHFALSRFETYIEILGIVALGLESTLPVPQLLANFRRKSTIGFSDLVLAGWLGGDLFKTAFYLLRHSPMQFTICGAITVLLDLCVLAQRLAYRNQTTQLPEHHEEEETEEYTNYQGEQIQHKPVTGDRSAIPLIRRESELQV